MTFLASCVTMSEEMRGKAVAVDEKAVLMRTEEALVGRNILVREVGSADSARVTLERLLDAKPEDLKTPR